MMMSMDNSDFSDSDNETIASNNETLPDHYDVREFLCCLFDNILKKCDESERIVSKLLNELKSMKNDKYCIFLIKELMKKKNNDIDISIKLKFLYVIFSQIYINNICLMDLIKGYTINYIQ